MTTTITSGTLCRVCQGDITQVNADLWVHIDRDTEQHVATPMPRFDLLIEFLKWAAQDRLDLTEEFTKRGWPGWNQSSWIQHYESSAASVCSTTACIAGNAVYVSDSWQPQSLAKAVLNLPNHIKAEVANGWDSSWAVPVKVAGTDALDRKVYAYDDTRNFESISEVGKHELRLTGAEANALFDEGNTVEDLVHLIRLFAQSCDMPTGYIGLEDLAEELGESTEWRFDRTDGWYTRGGDEVTDDEPYDPEYA